MATVTLWQGDCLDLMNDIPDKSIDMILCDLPYGTTQCGWDIIIPLNDYIEIENKKLSYDEFTIFMMNNAQDKDNIIELKNKISTIWSKNKKLGLWSHYNRIIKDNGAIVLFGQEPFSSILRQSNIEDYKYDIYWEKERLTNIQQVKRRVGKTVETISVFYKKQCTYNPQMVKYDGPPRQNKVKNGTLGLLTDNNKKKANEYHDTGYRYPTQVWKYKRDILKSNLHPTQKPVELLKNLIRTYTNEGDVVLDNCMGSCSTGIACMETNRKFIGIEKKDKFFNISQNRINEETDMLAA